MPAPENSAASARRRLPFRALYLAPVLALIALSAWVFASPIGAGPDDDFHLVSVWCATGSAEHCLPGSEPSHRVVPESVLELPCFAFDSTESAACQARQLDFDPTPSVDTGRGNFVGAYPPIYYAVMSVFVGDDILVSALVMRFVNVLLFVGLTSVLFWLLPVPRRSTLVWGWLITTMPLGIFLIASNNPSGWAVTGIGTAWLALLGYFETTGWRRLALGAVATVGVLMAAGARGDAALYAAGAVALVLVLTAARSRVFLLHSILPALLILVALSLFLSARQVGSGIGGLGSSASIPGSDGTAEQALAGFGLLAFNVLNVPFIWSGVFGSWGLGWLDTSMPWVVVFAAVAVFTVVGFVGLANMTVRKAIAVGGVGLTLWALPVYVLTASGSQVLEGVQPRYILPLIVLLGGVLTLTTGAQRISLSRVQTVTVVAALSVTYFIALHMNIRRYVTGTDAPGADLSSQVEWWWTGVPGPTVVWLVGSAAFAALVVVLVREIAPKREQISPRVLPEVAS